MFQLCFYLMIWISSIGIMTSVYSYIHCKNSHCLSLDYILNPAGHSPEIIITSAIFKVIGQIPKKEWCWHIGKHILTGWCQGSVLETFNCSNYFESYTTKLVHWMTTKLLPFLIELKIIIVLLLVHSLKVVL